MDINSLNLSINRHSWKIDAVTKPPSICSEFSFSFSLLGYLAMLTIAPTLALEFTKKYARLQSPSCMLKVILLARTVKNITFFYFYSIKKLCYLLWAKRLPNSSFIGFLIFPWSLKIVSISPYVSRAYFWNFFSPTSFSLTYIINIDFLEISFVFYFFAVFFSLFQNHVTVQGFYFRANCAYQHSYFYYLCSVSDFLTAVFKKLHDEFDLLQVVWTVILALTYCGGRRHGQHSNCGSKDRSWRAAGCEGCETWESLVR